MFGGAIQTVQQVRTTLDQLAAEDFAAASDCDLHAFVAEAMAAVSRLQAVVTAAVGEWDTACCGPTMAPPRAKPGCGPTATWSAPSRWWRPRAPCAITPPPPRRRWPTDLCP